MNMAPEDSQSLEQKIKRYRTHMQIGLIVKTVGVLLLLIALIIWAEVYGALPFTRHPKVLLFYVVLVGIEANVVHSWMKRRKNLAYMLEHELGRLLFNPYGYAITDAIMAKVAPQEESYKSHPVLGRYYGEIGYPGFLHGVIWMRFLYLGIATLIGGAVLVQNGWADVKVAGLTFKTWGWLALSIGGILVVIANFWRRIKVYQYGIVNQALGGKARYFFKDIYAVNFEKTYASGKNNKLESAQLDLQCIGLDVRFYISDARQTYYEGLERIAKVIHKACLHPQSKVAQQLACASRS